MKQRMSRGEKRLIGVMVGCVALLLGIGIAWDNLNRDPVINIPTPQMPAPNAFDFYVKAGQIRSMLAAATPGYGAVDPVTDTRSTKDLSPQQLARRYPTAGKVAWIQKCAPVLQTLRQGFAHPYLAPPERSFNVPFPHYAGFREMARLLIIESHAHSEQGDWASASRSTLDILHLGHDVPRGGPLIAALVGYAVNAIGRRELHKVLPHLDAAAARAAASRMEKLQARRVPFADTLQEEKWVGLAHFQQIMRTPKWRSGFLQGEEASWDDRVLVQLYSKRSIVAGYTRYMDALIAQSRLPYLKRKAPPRPSDPINQMMLPVFERADWNAARDETGNVLLLVALALRAFRLERGAPPSALSELVPSYLKKVPHDPFGGGEQLRYRRTGAAYRLYSVGPDGRDDGGKAIFNPNRATLNSDSGYLTQPDSTGDFVAGVNR